MSRFGGPSSSVVTSAPRDPRLSLPWLPALRSELFRWHLGKEEHRGGHALGVRDSVGPGGAASSEGLSGQARRWRVLSARCPHSAPLRGKDTGPVAHITWTGALFIFKILFFIIKLIGATLVNRNIQGSGVGFYVTGSVYGTVCPPPSQVFSCPLLLGPPPSPTSSL